MDTPLFTITEAMEKTGRSASTIRRLIHTITKKDTHPDRAAVSPDPKRVAAYKKKGENFTWTIRGEVLMKHFDGAQKEGKKSSPAMKGDILSILQTELALKNQQIEKQWEVIHALNDRLREGNILMGSLQKRLGPPSNESPADDVVEASAMKSSAESAMSPSAASRKRGIFAWMRGK